ncbi:MAG: PIN domain-containing protein [Polyangiaceae bacterium]|nr:PIN domain-containing protein [Polyangiaceae bacterium]
MKSLFVDTSAFVALADKRDRHHQQAQRFLRALARAKRPLVTSAYVADEVTTMVRMHIGHAQAVEVGHAILGSRWCRLFEVDEELRASAWNLFTRYDDQTFSFTDCTSFALMNSLGLDEAFTFDRRDFAAAGFSPLPSEVPR